MSKETEIRKVSFSEESQYFDLIKRGNIEHFKEFLEINSIFKNQINILTTSKGRHAFHLASFLNHLVFLEYFINDLHADVNLFDDENNNALHLACLANKKSSHLAVIQKMSFWEQEDIQLFKISHYYWQSIWNSISSCLKACSVCDRRNIDQTCTKEKLIPKRSSHFQEHILIDVAFVEKAGAYYKYLLSVGIKLDHLNDQMKLPIDLVHEEVIHNLIQTEMNKLNLDPEEIRNFERKLLKEWIFQWRQTGKTNHWILDENNKVTMLHFVAARRYFDILKEITKCPGVELNPIDIYGMTPMDILMEYRHQDDKTNHTENCCIIL